MNKIHVIGAGLAGLSAAVTATGAGRAVTVYESTAAGGGRCRSYFDTELGIRLDNGNHLLMSGNKSAFAYMDEIGARDRMTGPRTPVFPFVDLKTGREWTLRPSTGRIPWWLLFADRRVPKTTASEHLALRHIGREWDDTVMTETMRHSSLYWLLLEPLSVAALNTRPHEALACLFGAVLRETLLKGGKATLPRVPKEGLSNALVDPAIETLRKRGADVQFNRRITGLASRTAASPRCKPLMERWRSIRTTPWCWRCRPGLPAKWCRILSFRMRSNRFLNVHYKTEIKPEDDIKEAGVRRPGEWHRRMDLHQAGSYLDHRQRGEQVDRPLGGRSGVQHLAQCREGIEPERRAAHRGATVQGD